MDYVFASSLQNHAMPEIVTSYDIACQWSRNLGTRHDAYALAFGHRKHKFIYLVPKFHLPAHQMSCQYEYNFSYTKGVGRTDGEAVERGWAAVNPFATSTKEMGPGHRRDVLDDVFATYNWGKVRQLGKSLLRAVLPLTHAFHKGPTLLRKIKDAVANYNVQKIQFDEFNDGLPRETTLAWMEMVQKWEQDPSRYDNPFAATMPCASHVIAGVLWSLTLQTAVTMAAVRRELAEEEDVQHKTSSAAVGRAEQVRMSAGVMIAGGIDLEEQQYVELLCIRCVLIKVCRRRLQREYKRLSAHSTDKQRADVLEHLNTLRRKLDAWFKVQQTYIPGVENLRDTKLSAMKDCAAYDLPILLPSAIGLAVHPDPKLQDIEWRLRHAQAHDALNDLRRHLRLCSHLFQYKDRFVRGQRENTRARNVIALAQEKVDADAERYRCARSALVNLSRSLGKSGWESTLRVLEDDDIRLMSKGDPRDQPQRRPTDREREGMRMLSWIWRTTPIASVMDANDPQLQEGENYLEPWPKAEASAALRIEWCQARARANRWAEEIELIQEEMRRVIAYHDSMCEVWTRRLHCRPSLSNSFREGLSAYAHRQAEIRRSMRETCDKMWCFVRQWVDLGMNLTDGGKEVDESELDDAGLLKIAQSPPPE